ncbi:phBC6A51 family helix-turn-helix protein [Cytobacillus sp. Hm23]
MARNLTEAQIAGITILAMPKRNGMKYAEIAEEVGVTERTLQRWRKLDHFNEELKRQIMRNKLDRLPEVMESIPDHIIKDGNAAMFRTLLQAHSMLTEKVEVNSKAKEEGVSVSDMKAKIERFKQTVDTDE